MRAFRSYSRRNETESKAQWFDVDNVEFDAATQKAIATARQARVAAERAIEKAVKSGCVFSYRRGGMAFAKSQFGGSDIANAGKKLKLSDI